jgi:phosphoglycerate dehydrogenase-like enzyme
MPLEIVVLGRPDDVRVQMLSRLPKDVRITAGTKPEQLLEAAASAEIILCVDAKRDFLEPVFKAAKRVRWVHSNWSGVDQLLFPALVESPVPLTNARDMFSGALAEFAILGMLYFAKRVPRMLADQAANRWAPFDMDRLEEAAAGIVGYGGIGRAVASRARALGMKVLAVRRHPESSAGAGLVNFVYPPEARLEMIAACDYLVLSAPLTPETRHMIGEAEIRAMKPGAVLINVGRGPVVDEAALIRALEEKRIRGAALDVVENEPLAPGHPFYRMENVLLSPHCADRTNGWLERSMDIFFSNFERYLHNQPLESVVDKRAGY